MGEYITETYFSWQIIMLRIFGISTRENEAAWFKCYAATVPALALCLSLVAWHTILANLSHPRVFVDNMVFSFGFFVVFTKAFYMYLVKNRIIRTLPSLNNDLFVAHIRDAGPEKAAVKRIMFLAATQGIGILVLAYIYVGSAVLGPIVRWVFYRNAYYIALPFGDVSLFNATVSPGYEIACVYQCISAVVVVSNYISTNIFFGGVMAFLSAQCVVLQHVIRESVQSSRLEIQLVRDAQDVPEWKALHKILKEMVHHHRAITNATNDFENIYCVPALIDYLGLIIVTCTSMFYAIAMSTLSFRFVEVFALAFTAIGLQFITSYWGTELMMEYENIADACGEVDYTGTDIRFQKGICMIMQRSQKPAQFTVGNFAPLTLKSFLSVLRGAYSFYMVLHNLDLGSSFKE